MAQTRYPPPVTDGVNPWGSQKMFPKTMSDSVKVEHNAVYYCGFERDKIKSYREYEKLNEISTLQIVRNKNSRQKNNWVIYQDLPDNDTKKVPFTLEFHVDFSDSENKKIELHSVYESIIKVSEKLTLSYVQAAMYKTFGSFVDDEKKYSAPCGPAENRYIKAMHRGDYEKKQSLRNKLNSNILNKDNILDIREAAGVAVKLKDLQQNKDLNGKIGNIDELLTSMRNDGRFIVSISNGSRLLAIARDKFEVLAGNIKSNKTFFKTYL